MDIAILDDAILENTESFSVEAVSLEQGVVVIGNPSSASVTILDNDGMLTQCYCSD